MRVVSIERHSAAPNAFLTEVADPAVPHGWVLVRVEAAALNPLDAKIASGSMTDWFPVQFPYVPGTDFAGTIVSVGAGVEDLAPGDPVFGRTEPVSGGALADLVCLSADLVARRPQALNAREAACLPTPAGVAVQALARFDREHHDPLLIFGQGAVAVAAAAVVGPAARMVDAVDPQAVRGVTHVLDTVGGALQQDFLPLLPHGAHVISIVSPVPEGLATARGVEAEFVVLESDRRQLERLTRFAVDGTLRPHLDHVVAFDEAAATFDRYVARVLSGKIVIDGAGR
jgi:NADPH:quinone reductase-like Zn-dependent oxidoreductase